MNYFVLYILCFFLFGYSGSFNVHYLQNLGAKAPCQNYSYSRQIYGTKQKIKLRAIANKVIFRRKHLKYFSLFSRSSILKFFLFHRRICTHEIYSQNGSSALVGSSGPTSLCKQGHPRIFLMKSVHFS